MIGACLRGKGSSGSSRFSRAGAAGQRGSVAAERRDRLGDDVVCGLAYVTPELERAVGGRAIDALDRELQQVLPGCHHFAMATTEPTSERERRGVVTTCDVARDGRDLLAARD